MQIPNLLALNNPRWIDMPLKSINQSTDLLSSLDAPSLFILWEDTLSWGKRGVPIYRVSQKLDIILKAIILKTTESSLMKLNSLGVEYHKFILGPIP